MAERAEGGWTTRGERTAYDTRWVRIGLIDVTTPSGERLENYHVVELPPIALALVVVDDRVLLLWKYRFATGLWGYELPGGLIDDGEEASAAAARETAEESGWRVVGEPEHLLALEPLPGQVRAHTDVHRWRGATPTGAPTDPEEVDTVVEWVPVDRVPELVGSGRILGSSTGLALLYHHATGRS